MSSTSCEHTWENFELIEHATDGRGDCWECRICGVKIQEEELPSIKEYDQEIEELRAQLRESQHRETQWKKIAEEAQQREQATARSLCRWQHNGMIEGDFIDENGNVVGDPYLERDRAITQYLEAQHRAEQWKRVAQENWDRAVVKTAELCTQVIWEEIKKWDPEHSWDVVGALSGCFNRIKLKFAHVAQPSADPSDSPSEKSAKVTRQDEETAEGTSTGK